MFDHGFLYYAPHAYSARLNSGNLPLLSSCSSLFWRGSLPQTREFADACLHSLTGFYWIMPIVHGAFVQRKVYDYGRSMNIILLARRSRHFAGTR